MVVDSHVFVGLYLFWMCRLNMLVIVLDMNIYWWNGNDRFDMIVESVGFYVGIMGQSLAFPAQLKVAVIAAFSEKSETILVGDEWKFIGGLREGLKRAILVRQRDSRNDVMYESPIGQGLTRALCLVNKERKRGGGKIGKIVMFDCTMEMTDLTSQSVALSNCGWAANGTDDDLVARVHVVSLASSTPSSSLIAVCAKTGGVHIPYVKCQSFGELIQAMLFHLTLEDEGLIKILKTRPQSQRLHMGTVCACHNKSIDKGYVCSICLSIYCTETAGICSVCGSRVRREAKDELPISLQIFSKLFSSDSSSSGAMFG